MALDSKYVPSSSTRLPCAWILHRTVTPLDKGDAGFFWRLLGSGSSRLLVLGKWLLASDPSGHLQHVRLDQENEGAHIQMGTVCCPKYQPEMKCQAHGSK